MMVKPGNQQITRRSFPHTSHSTNSMPAALPLKNRQHISRILTRSDSHDFLEQPWILPSPLFPRSSYEMEADLCKTLVFLMIKQKKNILHALVWAMHRQDGECFCRYLCPQVQKGTHIFVTSLLDTHRPCYSQTVKPQTI